jgi:hypothetical protein
MLKVFLIPAVIFAFCFNIAAQEYVEASGQTAVFTLQAGAKAPWSGILMMQRSAGRSLPISLSASRNGATISFCVIGQKAPSAATIAVYAVNGSLLERVGQSNDGSFHLSRNFADGFYTVRLEKAGQTLVSTNFLAAR